MALSLSVGKTYNFSTYAPARLGQKHKAMIVTSQLAQKSKIILVSISSKDFSTEFFFKLVQIFS
jgi:hypothetical protein